nr:hypothetical protein [Moorena bouillonii]
MLTRTEQETKLLLRAIPNGVGELSLIRASWFMGFLMAILNSDETPSCSSFQLFCPVLSLDPPRPLLITSVSKRASDKMTTAPSLSEPLADLTNTPMSNRRESTTM